MKWLYSVLFCFGLMYSEGLIAQPTGQSAIYFRILKEGTDQPIFGKGETKKISERSSHLSSERYQILELKGDYRGFKRVFVDGTVEKGTFWFEDHHFAIVRNYTDTFYLSFLRFPPHYLFVELEFRVGHLKLDGGKLEHDYRQLERKLDKNRAFNITPWIDQLTVVDEIFIAKLIEFRGEIIPTNETNFNFTLNSYGFNLAMEGGVYEGKMKGRCTYDSDSTQLCQVNQGWWLKRTNQIQDQMYNEEPDPTLDQNPTSFQLNFKNKSMVEVEKMEFRNHDHKKLLVHLERLDAGVVPNTVIYRYDFKPADANGAIYLWLYLKEEKKPIKIDIHFKDVIELNVFNPQRYGSRFLLTEKDSTISFNHNLFQLPFKQLEFKK